MHCLTICDKSFLYLSLSFQHNENQRKWKKKGIQIKMDVINFEVLTT